MPIDVKSLDPASRKLFSYFRYRHLPEHLQSRSRPFRDLAEHILESTPASAERTAAMRKLLEAKDCAVRAALPDDPED